MISCYQIEDVLGRGGFAVTYLAIDLNLDVHVAIKEYLPREIIQRDEQLNVSARRPEFVEDYNIGLNNFAREAKTLARFKHLNIVRVHQVIHKHSTAYMVMDYEHGREFADVLEEHKTIPEAALRDILFPIFDGVEEIHLAGLAHRDIKPSNIYLRENGSPVLLDFGAARYTMSETTQQLTAVVTVGYTPIEQYNVSDNDQGPWSDIYALAAVLYEAVTGEMPVDSVTRASSTLTAQQDPLASVSNKAQQHYSDNFMKAIDWGLKMEAEDRPQSIAQWRAAFNGDYRPASAFEQKKPPSRPSRLKTRDRYPPEVNHEPEQPSAPFQSDPRHTEDTPAPFPGVDVRSTRFDPQFGKDIDDVDIIHLNTPETISHDDGANVFSDQQHLLTPDNSNSDHVAEGKPDNTTDFQPTAEPTRIPPNNQDQVRATATPTSPFASNPAIANRGTTQAANRNTIEPQTARPASPESALDATTPHNQTLNNTLSNMANNPGQTTHTQELRNVLRRDIVKRNPAASASTPTAADDDRFPPPYGAVNANNNAAPGRFNNKAPASEATPQRNSEYRQPPRKTREPIRQAPIRNEIQFDETDWDYEHPTPPSKWRWLLPAAGLIAVVGGPVLYVNKPDLFKLPSKDVPEMTVATALDNAQLQISDGALIFPTGQSAFDYYQLILSGEPDNQQAIDGIANIQSAVKNQIIENIDANDLNEANRILSQANARGLQIEGLPGPANQPLSSQTTTSGAVGIDQSPSPWVNEKVATIEQLIGEQKFIEAEELFNETDKYLADANLSSSLQEQIKNGKNGVNSQPAVETLTTQDQNIPSSIADNQARVSAEQNQDEPLFAPNTTEIPEVALSTADIDNTSSGTVPDATVLPIAPTTLPAPRENNFQEPSREIRSGATTPLETDFTSNVDQNIAVVNNEPEPLPSAPRRSFIDGNDATARHLNQLRVAIEAKNLGEVLNISNSLPAERTEFLRKMFQRYDRLDVAIDDINTAANSATARLSVSMFNQRSDGSYYSAGKWNGVTLSTDQQNGAWQKIQW